MNVEYKISSENGLYKVTADLAPRLAFAAFGEMDGSFAVEFGPSSIGTTLDDYHCTNTVELFDVKGFYEHPANFHFNTNDLNPKFPISRLNLEHSNLFEVPNREITLAVTSPLPSVCEETRALVTHMLENYIDEEPR